MERLRSSKPLSSRTPVGEVVERDLEVHVVAGVAGDVERGVGRAEPRGAVAEGAAGADVGRQAGGGVVGAAVAGDDGADAGLALAAAVVGLREVVAGHHPVGAAAVAAVAVGEGADDGQLVGALGHFREDAAELDAGQTGRRRTDGAAEFDGRVRLGVEGFDLGRPAAEPEPDDGGVARGLALRGGPARARRRSGSKKPPRPSAPTLRKSRRLEPSQLVPLRDPLMLEHAFAP